MKALIIGGGICGPVTAMALQRAGIEPVVYEGHQRTAADVGSVLTVASNGLNALAAIGAHEPVASAGCAASHIVLFSATGKRLGAVPIGSRDGSDASRTLQRAHLHRALRDEAVGRGVRIEFGKRLVNAETTQDGVVARFADGTEVSGDMLIGCDGIHSVTRRLIDPQAPRPRYVGLLNFGGYTPAATAAPRGEWRMIFGKRAFFGYTSDDAGGTAWFANVPRQPVTPGERETTTLSQWKHWLLDLFLDDDGPATDLIWAGALDLAGDNTHDLPRLPAWHRGRMIVIGDAAHAPSPTSGQGASLAIEDGVVLAKCVRDVRGVPQAFATFERLRRKRVEAIVAHGARGSSNKAVGGIGRVFRDLMLPIVFRYVVTEKSVAWMYDHRVNWDQPIAQPG